MYRLIKKDHDRYFLKLYVLYPVFQKIKGLDLSGLEQNFVEFRADTGISLTESNNYSRIKASLLGFGFYITIRLRGDL